VIGTDVASAAITDRIGTPKGRGMGIVTAMRIGIGSAARAVEAKGAAKRAAPMGVLAMEIGIGIDRAGRAKADGTAKPDAMLAHAMPRPARLAAIETVLAMLGPATLDGSGMARGRLGASGRRPGARRRPGVSAMVRARADRHVLLSPI
jgi:hypothetical protein